MATDVTGTVGEDGALVVKGEDGKETRYTPESALLEAQEKLTTAEKASGSAASEAETKLGEAKNAQIKAEAEAERLTEEIKTHTGTTEELDKLKTELKTAITTGESSATELLTLRRNVVVATYGVPQATVDSKDLAALTVYEEALKSVLADKAAGNFAIGGGGGGADALKDKSPMELAALAYADKK